MNLKKILKNVKKDGISETYKNYKIRKKKKKEKEYYKSLQPREYLKKIDEIKAKSESQELTAEDYSALIEIMQVINKIASYASADTRKKELNDLFFIEKMKILCKMVASAPSDEIKKEMNHSIIELEKIKGYKGAIKELYILNILPEAYNKLRNNPITNTIVFMERGEKKSPSLNYMYEKVKNDKKYDIKLHELKLNVGPVTTYYMNALKYIEDCATAKGIFNCTANDLMGHFELRPETTYIQLWHGCGAFKKVGRSTEDKAFGKSAKAREKYPDNTNYSYVTIASPEVSWVFEEAMGIKKDSGIIVPTGISRTDEFFDEKYKENCINKIRKIIPETENKKIILYAPTFRGAVATATSPDFLDIEKFHSAFSDEYILIIKHHQSAKTVPEIPEKYRDSFAFDMTRGKGMTINDLMTVADVMITDYSSVVFEYALFERPMVFLVPDIEQYIDERGLYYDFNEITPGPLCYTNEDVIEYINNLGSTFDKQVVTDFKNKFMSCCDGHSTERILKLLENN